MKLTKVLFDDGEVSYVHFEVESIDELVFIADTMGPEGMIFPITLAYDAISTEMLFAKAGDIPGNHPDGGTASDIFNALMPVVDKFIRAG